MSYLGFLILFLLLPLAALGRQTLVDGHRDPHWFGRSGRWVAGALLVHVLLAVTYTTPWDNYLVATRVWWYDPQRVLGITLGWVPLEEYFFFVLQTLLTGLLLLALSRRLRPDWPDERAPDPRLLRIGATLGAAAVWLAAAAGLAVGWQPGTYLGLELVWALPPIALQLAAGADILWRYRRRVLAALLGATLYLCAADFLAIDAQVWTINPAQSLNLLVAGVLPIEEIVFFLLTNTLVVFGLTLALAPEMQARAAPWLAGLRRRWPIQEGA